jgi:hypothetical protein
MVRANLWSALCHLRLPKRDRFLWIDAICIDQGNILERNHQVKRMGSIYEGASKVLVWLGPQKDQSDIALSFIEDIGKAAQKYWESLPIYENATDGKALDFNSPNFNNDPNLTFTSTEKFDKAFVKSNIHEKEWASVRLLCNWIYWKRIWIIQEICLARQLEICCGPKSVPWERFAAMCRSFGLLAKARDGYQVHILSISSSLPAGLCQKKLHLTSAPW